MSLDVIHHRQNLTAVIYHIQNLTAVIYTKHINTQCGQNVQFLSVKLVVLKVITGSQTSK
jgi:hypothetical protein